MMLAKQRFVFVAGIVFAVAALELYVVTGWRQWRYGLVSYLAAVAGVLAVSSVIMWRLKPVGNIASAGTHGQARISWDVSRALWTLALSAMIILPQISPIYLTTGWRDSQYGLATYLVTIAVFLAVFCGIAWRIYTGERRRASTGNYK